MLKTLICPSLLSADMAALGAEAEKALSWGGDWLHVDIMDFHFVPNLAFGVQQIRDLRQYLDRQGHKNAFLDCHLMIENPTKWLEDIKKAGADRFTLHIEAIPADKVDDAFEECKRLGVPCGLALKPKTPVEVVLPYIDRVDLILVMTVEPGFGGQSFMIDQMEKVRFLRNRFPDLNIQVDGGLSVETTITAAKEGANIIVAGSSIFHAPEPKGVIVAMRYRVEQEVLLHHQKHRSDQSAP
jgi:ribulose-phosphate 3-epimerase